MAPSDFGRSVNPISSKGDRLRPPNNTGTPEFSDLPMALRCKRLFQRTITHMISWAAIGKDAIFNNFFRCFDFRLFSKILQNFCGPCVHLSSLHKLVFQQLLSAQQKRARPYATDGATVRYLTAHYILRHYWTIADLTSTLVLASNRTSSCDFISVWLDSLEDLARDLCPL